MADEIKLKAPTVEQQVNVVINGEEKLKSFANTLEKISSNKNLQKYFKDQKQLINDVSNAYGNFIKHASKNNASELMKTTNALKALSDVDISSLVPDFKNFSQALENANKVAGDLDSAFSVNSFKDAFSAFDMLRAYGIDLENFFKHFDLDINVTNLQESLRLAEQETRHIRRELSETQEELSSKKIELASFIDGSGMTEQIEKLRRLEIEINYVRERASEEFKDFLKGNDFSSWDLDEKGTFEKYFNEIREGTLTAKEAIAEFKREYSYLLQDKFAESGGLFNLQQVQEFENKLESVLIRVEGISRQINDIVENGVMTKAMQNLSVDSSISQSQRELFANVLKDEESLSSIATVLKKIIDESVNLQNINNKTFDEEQFNKLLDLFTKIESSLSSMKAVFADAGDGEEFSPLLKMIDNVQKSIESLNSSAKNIGLNMNVDIGSNTEKFNDEYEAKLSKALIAYESLFERIKQTSIGGSEINRRFFDFDLSQFDTTLKKLEGIKNFIEEQRRYAKELYGYDALKDESKAKGDSSYWTRASAAMGQVTSVKNKMKMSVEDSPLDSLFSKTDLTEVISQLNLIVDKLGEISNSAAEFRNVFKEGFNISASIEEIEKLTNKVKELENELSKVQTSSTSPVETNISSPIKDTFQEDISHTSAVEQQNKLQEELHETQEEAKKARDIVSQVGLKQTHITHEPDDDGNMVEHERGQYSFIERLQDGQLKNVLVTYDEDTKKWTEDALSLSTAFEQVGKEIISLDNKINQYENARNKTLKSHPTYDTSADDALISQTEKRRQVLLDTLALYDRESGYQYEIVEFEKRRAENTERLKNVTKKQENLSDVKEAKELLAAEYQITKETEKQSELQQKKWQAFYKEQQDYVGRKQETDAIERNKSAYQELLDAIKQYGDVSKRIAKNETLDGDLELAQKLEDKISELQKQPILSSSQVAKSERELENLFDQLIVIEKQVAQNREAEIWEKNTKAITDFLNAQTKLNNLEAQDKHTGKKAKELEEQTKKVKELEKAAEEAKRSLFLMIDPFEYSTTSGSDKWKEIQLLFTQGFKGSEESVAKLEDALRNFKNSTINSLSNDINKIQDDYNKFNSRIDQSTEYQDELKVLENKRDELKNLQNELKAKDFIDQNDLDKIKELKRQADLASQAIRNMTFKGSSEISRDKLLDKIGDYLKKNTRMSKDFREELEQLYKLVQMRGVDANVSDLTDEFLKLKIHIREAKQEGESFWDILTNKAVHNYAAQLVSYYLSWTDFIRYGQQAIEVVKNLDYALIDLKKTTVMNSSQLEDFYFEANDIAKQMGVTTQQIIEQSSAWSRLGYNTKEQAAEMAKLSSQFAAISPGMDTEQAQEGLVSIMKAFKVDVADVETEIMDKINILGNKFAEENQDIVEGLKRSSAAMAAMGQSFTDTAALFTGGMEILQDAETMGSALRSVSMRIRGYDEETEELSDSLANVKGEVADLTKTASNPNGISLFTDASQTHYKSMVQYLGEISDIWDEISEKNQTDLLQQLFGKTRAQAGAAIITNFSQVRKAIEEMEKSAGSADAEMEAVESSLNFKINALKETWVGNVQEMVDRGDLGTIIDGLTKLSEAIGWVVDKAGMLGTIGLGAGLFAGIKNIGRPKMFGLYKYADINMCSLGY